MNIFKPEKRYTNPFFDIHCHLMTFDEPDFIMFLKQVTQNLSKEAMNSLFTPDYLIDFKNKNLPSKVGNLINVMSHSQQEMAEMLEGDLRGEYVLGDEKPFVKDEKFHFANLEFDRYIICPLVMDFTSNIPLDAIHYTSSSNKDAFWHADKMLKSIREFYQENTNSLLEIMPFTGINPSAYSLAEIQRWLDCYFDKYKAKTNYQHKKKPRFYGIKLYPPLGLNPNPEDKNELEKVELIYSYAEAKGIPITTHCDDGGYRITDVDVAHAHTSPDIWKKVLERHPKLKLNFAHFGKQYHRGSFMKKQEGWRNSIIDLIVKYDNVYTDLSFNGFSNEYYERLKAKLEGLDESTRKKLNERIMFGSDFMINLSKAQSYYHYVKMFEESPLSTEEKVAYASGNCKSFLFND